MGRRTSQIGFVALMLVLAAPAIGTEPPSNQAYRELGVEPPSAEATFHRRTTRVGDRIDQRVEVKLDLQSTVRNGEEVVSQHETHLARLQHQTMVADEVADGKTLAARVKFHQAEHKLNDTPSEASPVVGQIYRCRREGEELQVTRDDGTLPTPQEHEQVSASMTSLGRTSPLAEYFAGKTIAQGTKLTLPKELGTTLLGADGALGEVSRFEMTLKEVVVREGRRIACFDTELEAEAGDGVQMRLLLAGTIELSIDTCRTERLALEGPLARLSSFGSYSRRETTSVRGKMEIVMQATYTDK